MYCVTYSWTKWRACGQRKEISLLPKAFWPGLRPTQLHIQLVLEVKWLCHEAGHTCLSIARVKNVWNSTYTFLYTLIMWWWFKHGDSSTIHEAFSCYRFLLLSTNCRELQVVECNLNHALLVHNQQWQNAVQSDEELCCGHCLYTPSSKTSVTWERRERRRRRDEEEGGEEERGRG